MRYVAAALLAALGGKNVDAKSIEAILNAAGVDVDGDEVSRFADRLGLVTLRAQIKSLVTILKFY